MYTFFIIGALKAASNGAESMKIDQALKQAEKAKSKGNLSKAINIYKKILAKFPNNTIARVGLAELARITQPHPTEVQHLIRLMQNGEFKMVAQLATTITQRYPNAAVIHNILGASFASMQQGEKAEKAYKRAISLDPTNADFHSNLAQYYQHANNHNQAIQSYKAALHFAPYDSKLYYNLGLSYQILGQVGEAISFYEKTLNLNPELPEVLNNLGVAQQIEGNLEAACESYLKSLKLKADYVEARNNLGTIYNLQDKHELAKDCFETAIKHNANYAQAYINLCELLEKLNRPKEMLDIVKSAKKQLKLLPPDICYFEALGAFRQKNFSQASKLISTINVNKISTHRITSFLHLSAQIAHNLGHFDQAFDLFKHMNNQLIKSAEYIKLDVDGFFQRIKRDSKNIPSFYVNTLNVQNDRPTPVFLIGFPRSGTTLLDTILLGHSQISIIEEQNMVPQMEALILGKANIWDAELLGDDEVRQARKVYYDILSLHERDKTKMVIDKMPLNITKVPLIHRVFPNARYILALRHPLDTILSCWMQNFALNSAMGNMLDLTRIAQFYEFSMQIFEASTTRYGLNVHRVRYEDLLSDLEFQVRAVIDFLELEWQDNLLDYQTTAMGRGRIHTPSYSQVIEPLYTSATDRWRKYSHHLVKEHALVSKWIKAHGYRD